MLYLYRKQIETVANMKHVTTKECISFRSTTQGFLCVNVQYAKELKLLTVALNGTTSNMENYRGNFPINMIPWLNYIATK